MRRVRSTESRDSAVTTEAADKKTAAAPVTAMRRLSPSPATPLKTHLRESLSADPIVAFWLADDETCLARTSLGLHAPSDQRSCQRHQEHPKPKRVRIAGPVVLESWLARSWLGSELGGVDGLNAIFLGGLRRRPDARHVDAPRAHAPSSLENRTISSPVSPNSALPPLPSISDDPLNELRDLP